MSLKALPVLERMIADNGQVFTYEGTGEWEFTRLGMDLLEMIASQAKRVSLDIVMDDPVTTGNIEVNLEKYLGQTALPYPVMWIEWEVGDGGGATAGDDFALRRMGALCLNGELMQLLRTEQREAGLGTRERNAWDELPEGADPETSWQMLLFAYSAKRNEPVMMVPGVLCACLDSSGQFVAAFATVADPELTENLGMDGTQDDDTVFMLQLAWGAIMAVGWMNCKNVDTVAHQGHYTATEKTKIPGRKTKSKRVRKFVDYHTIQLPHGATGGGGGGTGTGGQLRMHTVRGHFKTFTKESPLFGKAAGTYWWGYQLRGNPQRGVTVTDYQIKETDEVRPQDRHRAS